MPSRERREREQQRRAHEETAAAGPLDGHKKPKESLGSAADRPGSCAHFASLPASSAATLWKALSRPSAASRICLECGGEACAAHPVSVEAGASAEVYCSACQAYCWSADCDALRLHAHYSRKRAGVAPLALALPPGAGLRGLINLGNTCFMNSVLQGLLHLPALRESFLCGAHRRACDIARQSEARPAGKADGNALLYRRLWARSFAPADAAPMPSATPPQQPPSAPPRAESATSTAGGAAASAVEKTPACFACELEYLLGEMWCGESSATPISPEHLLQTLWESSDELAGYLQQDAQEFFSFLVNQLHAHSCQTSTLRAGADVMSPSHANRNGSLACSCVVHANLGGVLKSSLQCCACGAESSSFEPFFDLSLPLDRSTSLQQCLDAFIRTESLHGQEQVLCDACRARQDFSKTMSIYQLPDVFTVHMKRFETGAKAANTRKMDAVVEFPVSALDLRRYASEPCREHPGGQCACALYDLHALVQHSGQLGNMDAGHYVSFVRQDGLWFRFDDALGASLFAGALTRRRPAQCRACPRRTWAPSRLTC